MPVFSGSNFPQPDEILVINGDVYATRPVLFYRAVLDVLTGNKRDQWYDFADVYLHSPHALSVMEGVILFYKRDEQTKQDEYTTNPTSWNLFQLEKSKEVLEQLQHAIHTLDYIQRLDVVPSFATIATTSLSTL
jgi:hypothetical protein